MKTARFSKVVEKCGQPEEYLLLMDPAKDRTFQAAVKAQKVMTIFQETVGTKADRGEVGFEPGPRRQFLVFPKSLKPFAGSSVVGIKYDLLKSPEFKESGRAKASRPAKRLKPKREPRSRAEPELKPAPKPKRAKPTPAPESTPAKPKPGPKPGMKGRAAKKEQPPEHNVVAFEPKVEDADEAEENEEITRLKDQVRRAMAVLEEGKAVAAFNLLKRIVE